MLGARRAPIGGWWIHHGGFLCFVAEVLRLTDCVSEFLMYVAHHISHLPAGVRASYSRTLGRYTTSVSANKSYKGLKGSLPIGYT